MVAPVSVEILTAVLHTSKAWRALSVMKEAIRNSGDSIIETDEYQGNSDWLVLWGVGARAHNEARNKQRAKGKRALLLDMGYTNRESTFRMSIDDDHPHRWLDKTPDDRPPVAALKDTYSESGHIVIAGIGAKSKRYLGLKDWERSTYAKFKKEFPGRRIVIKEKTDKTPIEDVLQGASLVVARHSNCCVDAAIHNIPFRCSDGAAFWLKDLRDRELLLRKIAYWQTNADGAMNAWRFIKEIA